MFTVENAIDEARKILESRGIKVICLDTVKNVYEIPNEREFRRIVDELVDDTIYWED